MKARNYLATAAAFALVACGPSKCTGEGSNPAGERQARATRTSMDAADREIGMPRITNFSQRRLLKNAYEDMDTTTLTYVYTQGLDGMFVCLGQAIGYGVSLGTQFTAGTYPQRIIVPLSDGTQPRGYGDIYNQDQPEPNGLYSPTSGAATIVNLINPVNGEAHTALMEPDIVTVPFPLPAQAVRVQCPASIDPARVHDAQETNAVRQR